MLDANKNYVIQTDGSIHEFLFYGDCDWEERAVTSIQEIRAEVIDEFAERLQEKVESFQTEINGFKADVLTLDYFVEFVDEIAEEMKGKSV